MAVHIFGIRHHGPGSARSLCQALATLQPDLLLVEGPPDAQAILPLLVQAQMRPPVALLIYAPDSPQQAAYYPFAVFSPEWQALRYGLQQSIPVRWMDLPQAHRFALRQASDPVSAAVEGVEPASESLAKDPPDDQNDPGEAGVAGPATAGPATPPAPAYRADPLSLLAQAAGYSDGERWWEHLVEQRQDSTELFAAILAAMTVLRTAVQADATWVDPLEAPREAYMRKTIREAQREGFERIAVVCGAWHAPALAQMPPAKGDTALLKGLPKLKVEATWVPWTYGHLLMSSGYGAGIESPGWYHHLWKQGERSAGSAAHSSIRWLTKVARLLRSQDLDASSASVIEAVRLAETLAALRDLSRPGLSELNEASQTVLCFGDPLPMQLIQQQLMVGERLGQVPDETPMVPLQQDLQRQQQRLRLPPEANERSLELDLRKPGDLVRSHLLHRLQLLGVPWGQPQAVGKTKGTFREVWRLRWQPEFAVRLIEVGLWGNTIEIAATAWTCNQANTANLPTLTQLIDQTLLAHLPEAILQLMSRLQAEAALASDITHLMAALPPLVNSLRYGTVRQVETGVIGPVVKGLITRICIGLPLAAACLDDEAAATLYPLVISVQTAIGLLQDPEALATWQGVLAQMVDQQGLHGRLAGRCCRLLFEAGVFQSEDTARRLGLALSTASDPAQSAAWIEGFLSGSGLLLLHNPSLWQVLDQWVVDLPDNTFTSLLPLLRRTFSTFPAPERRQMGDRVRQGHQSPQGQGQRGSFDDACADAVLPLVAQLLGVSL